MTSKVFEGDAYVLSRATINIPTHPQRTPPADDLPGDVHSRREAHYQMMMERMEGVEIIQTVPSEIMDALGTPGVREDLLMNGEAFVREEVANGEHVVVAGGVCITLRSIDPEAIRQLYTEYPRPLNMHDPDRFEVPVIETMAAMTEVIQPKSPGFDWRGHQAALPKPGKRRGRR